MLRSWWTCSGCTLDTSIQDLTHCTVWHSCPCRKIQWHSSRTSSLHSPPTDYLLSSPFCSNNRRSSNSSKEWANVPPICQSHAHSVFTWTKSSQLLLLYISLNLDATDTKNNIVDLWKVTFKAHFHILRLLLFLSPVYGTSLKVWKWIPYFPY